MQCGQKELVPGQGRPALHQELRAQGLPFREKCTHTLILQGEGAAGSPDQGTPACRERGILNSRLRKLVGVGTPGAETDRGHWEAQGESQRGKGQWSPGRPRRPSRPALGALGKSTGCRVGVWWTSGQEQGPGQRLPQREACGVARLGSTLLAARRDAETPVLCAQELPGPQSAERARRGKWGCGGKGRELGMRLRGIGQGATHRAHLRGAGLSAPQGQRQEPRTAEDIRAKTSDGQASVQGPQHGQRLHLGKGWFTNFGPNSFLHLLYPSLNHRSHDRVVVDRNLGRGPRNMLKGPCALTQGQWTPADSPAPGELHEGAPQGQRALQVNPGCPNWSGKHLS